MDNRLMRGTAFPTRLLAGALLSASLGVSLLGAQAASAAPAESLKLVVTPKVVSLTNVDEGTFRVEVSGHSRAHAALSVFIELESDPSCAPNAQAESEVPEASQQNPAQAEPGTPEKYPATFATDFTGAFDWDTNSLLLLANEGAKPGRKLVCAYLSLPASATPPATTTGPSGEVIHPAPPAPLLTAKTSFNVILGNVPKKKHKAKKHK